MSVLKIILLLAVVLVPCIGATAQDQQPQSILDALPTAQTLGQGWAREISVLFDPLSNPPEIIGKSARLSETFRQERRAAVENPTNTISGSSHLNFVLQATNGTHRYDVQLDRYRRKESLHEDFNRLLALDSEQYHKTIIHDIGDSAVVYRAASGGNMTVWFRRGQFKVWISPMNSTSSWEQDAALKHLAKSLDQRMRAPKKETLSPPKETQKKPEEN